MVIERTRIGHAIPAFLLVIVFALLLSGCKISLPKGNETAANVSVADSAPAPQESAPAPVAPEAAPQTPAPAQPPSLPPEVAPPPQPTPTTDTTHSTLPYQAPNVQADTADTPVRPNVKKEPGPMRPDLFVDVIDVGPGQSILVRTPSSKTALLDCGPKEYASRVVMFLQSKGINSLDALLITNYEHDRIGACEAVISKIPAGTIIQGIDMPSEPVYDKLMDFAQETDIPVQRILHDTNLSLDPKIAFSLIVPYDKIPTLAGIRSRSLLTRITYGDVGFFFTSDCEQGCERAIHDNLTDDMHATVYTIGAHAAERSGTRLLFENLSAEVGILSANRSEAADEEPFKDTLKKYTNTGMKIYRTDYDGTVTVASDGGRYAVNVTGGIEHWSPSKDSNTTLTATPDCPFVAHYNSNFYYTFDCPLSKLVDPGWKLCFATRKDADDTRRHLDNRCA